MSVIRDLIENSRELETSTVSDLATVSIPTSRVICGDLQLTNTIDKLTFDAITYTGNGTSQTITTGLSSIDLTDQTQALTTTGLPVFHDRGNVSGVGGDCIMVNASNVVVDSGSIAFDDYGIDGLIDVHIKHRNGTNSNGCIDGLRGRNKSIYTNLANAETTDTNWQITAFTQTGFTLPNSSTVNNLTSTYIAYINLYTHLKWGITDGVRWIEAYNPVTDMGMRIRQGSNSVINIPHSLGSIVDYNVTKQLNGTATGIVYYGDKDRILYLYSATGSNASGLDSIWNNMSPTDKEFTFEGGRTTTNQSGGVYIDYYRAKSKTWGLFPYTGTGVAGNSFDIVDSDGNKVLARRVIFKAMSATGSHAMVDTERVRDTSTYHALILDGSQAEGGGNYLTMDISLGKIILNDNSTWTNGAGVQYIALVEFDTNANNGGSYAPIPTDTTQVQITDGLALYSTYNDGYVQTKEVVGTETLTINNGWE